MAGSVGRVQDFVVENGEVESQTQSDGMGRGQLGLGNVCGVLSRTASEAVDTRARLGAMGLTLYASCAAVAATFRFSPDANSAR